MFDLKNRVALVTGCSRGIGKGIAMALAQAGAAVAVNYRERGAEALEMGKPLLEAGVAARIPIGRPGTAQEIGHAVLLIVTNSYLTGQSTAARCFPKRL